MRKLIRPVAAGLVMAMLACAAPAARAQEVTTVGGDSESDTSYVTYGLLAAVVVVLLVVAWRNDFGKPDDARARPHGAPAETPPVDLAAAELPDPCDQPPSMEAGFALRFRF